MGGVSWSLPLFRKDEADLISSALYAFFFLLLT